MSDLIVITFDKLSDAREARRAIGDLEQEFWQVIDAAVVTKDASGKVDVDNELESSTKTGTLVGGVLGALLFLTFPVVGAVLGAVGGALVGKAIEPGIDQGFVRKVTEALKPGGSALFILVEGYERYDLPDALAALRPFNGTVYHTTLSSEGEDALRRALE